MKLKILALFVFIFLGGCGTTIDVTTTEVQTTPIHAPKPTPLILRKVEWKVLNKEKLEELINGAKTQKDTDLVLFSLNAQGYENLSKNMADIYGFILEQKASIDFLEQYINSRATQEQK